MLIYDLNYLLVGVENTGLDCWSKCGSKQGPCDWCGEVGTCCKKGYHDTSSGCDGTIGGRNRHECVLRLRPRLPGKLDIL